MSPLKKSNNIAARMGRWSASHWKTAVFGWLAFVAIAFVAGQVIGQKNIDESDVNVGQSKKADHIMRDAGFQPDPQTEIVLIQSDKLTVKDPAFRAVVDDTVNTVSGFKTLKNVDSPLDPAHADLVAADGHTAMVTFEMKGDDTLAKKNIDAITAATDGIAEAHPGFYVGEAGAVSS